MALPGIVRGGRQVEDRTWDAHIVEGFAETLQEHLAQYTAEGWTVFTILPNGVNRWTIVVYREP